MKIYGNNTDFKTFSEEKTLFGSIDTLDGSTKTVATVRTSFLWGTSSYSKSFKPRLHVHIPKNAWSVFTGKLREYLLPWRWKAVYLDEEGKTTTPKKILICTSLSEGELPDGLNKLAGASWFKTNLIARGIYYEVFGKEYFVFGVPKRLDTEIAHPLGRIFGVMHKSGPFQFFPIYRARDLLSTCRYYLLKRFSSDWKEVPIKAGNVIENMLIKKSHEAAIASYNSVKVQKTK